MHGRCMIFASSFLKLLDNLNEWTVLHRKKCEPDQANFKENNVSPTKQNPCYSGVSMLTTTTSSHQPILLRMILMGRGCYLHDKNGTRTNNCTSLHWVCYITDKLVLKFYLELREMTLHQRWWSPLEKMNTWE